MNGYILVAICTYRALHLLADEQLLKEHFRPTARIEINRWHHHRAWGGRLRLLPATATTGRQREGSKAARGGGSEGVSLDQHHRADVGVHHNLNSISILCPLSITRQTDGAVQCGAVV